MKNIRTIPLIYPLWKPRTIVQDIILVIAGSIFIAITAQMIIIVPFAPVPITGQTFGVLVIGALLGSKRGLLATIVYMLEGVLGLPVFAGATGGLAKMMGPTGGYILGFAISAYVTGLLFELEWDRSIVKVLLCLTIGTFIIFICGLIWLTTFVGLQNVLAMGFYPFIPGAILKIILAAIVIRSSSKYIEKISSHQF